jgi:predicted DCC family thiol-disulfide oxidoreductase YuxK
MSDERVVVFDGFCQVCSGGVRFVKKHPVEPAFDIVPMQSERGRELLVKYGIDPDDPMTFLVLDGGKAMTESDASIHLIAALGGMWRAAEAGRVVPKPVRDWMYRVLARNRYHWFGKRDTCYLP